MEVKDAVRAMVAITDCDFLGIEKCEEGMEGGETGAVCETGVLQQYTEDSLEACGVWGAIARVAIFVRGQACR